jgi:hypothetical protein
LIVNHIISDINIAREIIQKSEYSIVVVKNNKILAKKKGDGLKPILEVILELKDNILDTVIGDKILGKASALLCAYCKVKGVYSPQSTKKAIALLLYYNIPSQIDKIIPYIKNRYKNDICPFEKMIENVESPIDAYDILIKNIMK